MCEGERVSCSGVVKPEAARRLGRKQVSRRGFSLLELMIVVVLATALLILVSTQVKYTEKEALEAVRNKEMADIQVAFQTVYDDCVLTGTHLQDIAQYGVWPIFSRTHPDGGTDCDAYDADKDTGWRGPYGQAETQKSIDPASVGQVELTGAGAALVSVFLDPYGGYYRVIMPDVGATREGRLVLVCTGPDGVLNTLETAVGGYVEASGDDTILRLLPLAP